MTNPRLDYETRAFDLVLRATRQALAALPRVRHCRSCGEALDSRQEGDWCPACILSHFPPYGD